jgi:hypothetical protein
MRLARTICETNETIEYCPVLRVNLRRKGVDVAEKGCSPYDILLGALVAPLPVIDQT